MDDDLMRLFGGENIKKLMTKIGMQPGEPIYHPWLNRSIEKAQKKVEERNFEIRKHLLEYDDVLNQQRKFIYEQRNAILTDTALKNRVNDATADIVRELADGFRSRQRGDPGEAAGELAEQLRVRFGYHIPPGYPGRDSEEFRNPEILEERLREGLAGDIDAKEELIGPAYLNAIIREQYLMQIDRKWLDHLENMEALREAVYLRSYAQKNPLTEYKVEGFQIFDAMIDNIRREIASRLHLMRIRVEGSPAERTTRSVIRSQSASHGSVEAFSPEGAGAPSGTRAPSPAPRRNQGETRNITVVRAQPKVGRNDPCPCGSGKKYKHCHGR
jgi:preprotein translocase subunit SecA